MAGSLDVADLAFSYRRLVLWFGVQLAISCGGAGLLAPLDKSPLVLPLLLIMVFGVFATLVGLAYYGYRTSRALGDRQPWAWAVVMPVPYVNVVALLALSSRARRACTAHGIPVGLLGPKIQKS
jgi:hypothetical protein